MRIIIGAGAAGLLAALGSTNRQNIHIFDHQPHAGSKLMIAGGGRCNISNTGDILYKLHNTMFLRPALTALDLQALSHQLAICGIEVDSDDQGRVYPREADGRQFAQALVNYLTSQGVTFHFKQALTGIQVEESRLTGIEIDGKIIPTQQAILCCGGASWPGTGCDGSIFKILAHHHRILQPLPALVPLKTAESWPLEAKGISLTDIPVTIQAGTKILDSTRGDIIFTHFGLSGPGVLDASWAAAKALAARSEAQLTLDLLPNMTLQQLCRFLTLNKNKIAANALGELLPKQLAKLLAGDAPLKGLAPSTIEKKARSFKDQTLTITGTLGMKAAMVTQGGVDLREINPRTMESKKIAGLYVTGETLNYHGRTGGYNLHAAFATGFLAGQNWDSFTRT